MGAMYEETVSQTNLVDLKPVFCALITASTFEKRASQSIFSSKKGLSRTIQWCLLSDNRDS